MEHTSWEAWEAGVDGNWLVLNDKDHLMADCGEGKAGKERAERIALCHNAHDALVLALGLAYELAAVVLDGDERYLEFAEEYLAHCSRDTALAQLEE